MKTYLKLATLAMVLIAPAGGYAADPVAGPIGNQQETQQEPQRISDPVEFFDKTTGKVKVWYWRAESGYEFFDAPGFHPRTGGALTAVTLDVITEWQQSQKNATRCYIIQRDQRAPVIYRDHLPGMDPETGRECRLVTISLVERLNEYANGKKPGKIKSTPPEFFDPRTSEPIVWYADHGGTIEIFDLLGYDPETGDELLAVTPEIVDRWKAQVARKPPHRVDPNSHPFFDPKTGRPNIWHSPGENGEVEFFDGPGFHPMTGKALTEITQDFAKKRQQSKQNVTQCYIIQRGARAPVIYRDHPPGMDPETGRECRLVTTGLIERLKEYAEGKRPGRIKGHPLEFFDPRTREPIVWYVEHGGRIEIFDLLGYHPETSEELLPVTPEIVDRWNAEQAEAARKRPAPVDPDTHPFFDSKTGRPNIWHSPGESGALEFFDGPGFHPRTGKALTEITHDFADKRSRDILERAEKERAERAEKERAEHAEKERAAKELAKQYAAECDVLAANPNDQRRHSRDGVTYDQLKTQIPAAIHACELAVQLNPADLTLQYQRARAVELADPVRGQAMQDRLVKLGYPAAFDNAGSLLLNDPKCRQHCINEAVKLFRKGAAMGDPDAMMSLVDQIDQNNATGDKISLYQRAAKLGHPRAKKALEALGQERMSPRPIFPFPFVRY
jgi:hypothetical protein